MKIKHTLGNIFNYALILSPLLLSSLYIYGSKYPAWANTLLFASILSFIFSILLIYRYRKTGVMSKLSAAIILLAILFLIYTSLTAKTSPIFNLFGKGIEEWRAVGVLLFFAASAYFITLKGRLNKLALITSIVALVYTILNYFLIRNNLSIANYTAYANIPMISFAKLLCYPFVYTLVVFISSLIALTMEKRNYDDGNVSKKKWLFIPLFIIFVLSSIMLYRDVLRYIASNHYYKASASYTTGDLDNAKKELSRAIVIAPFDEYYLARIEVTNAMINKFLESNSTTTAAASNIYKEYVTSAIDDASAAIKYDGRSARNYMALGNAYERAILIIGDDGYKNALSAYEKARLIASDKDYVDVVKAKLSFGTGKEEEAAKYLLDALNYNPDSAIALFTSSQYQASKNNLAEAISYGERAVQVAPTAIDARLSLGILYLQNKDYTKAVDSFGNALAISGGQNLAAIYYLGISYAKVDDSSNLQAVINELEKRIAKDSDELKYLKGELARITDTRETLKEEDTVNTGATKSN